jgi:hypothetical protein
MKPLAEPEMRSRRLPTRDVRPKPTWGATPHEEEELRCYVSLCLRASNRRLTMTSTADII